MTTINLNKPENVEFLLYPDNQPHVNVKNVYEGDDVKVICSITAAIKLMNLLQVSNALDNLFARKIILIIPYLLGARFDRIMQAGYSFDLKVIADLINMMGFEKVVLFDPHSDISTALIRNSVYLTNQLLVESYNKPDSVLICPDAGAAKKIVPYFQNKSIVDVVYCIKKRDLSNGNLEIRVLEPEKCENKNCVIIDDICDGGGTFLGIAAQIKPVYLTLIVTHGIFSKGLSVFENSINEIIVSDSLPVSDNHLIKKISFQEIWMSI